MVMIPIDVGLQVRSQTEAPLHPLRPVAEIPSDLPDLQTGQAFRARIQEVLPDNTFKALVAGKSLTLSLPEGAKAGDTLELVVIDRTPRAIVAQLAERGLETAGEAYPHATLSRTGQLIASLLARDGESAAPTVLTGSRPLLPSAPASAAQLAQRLPQQLAQAVSTSGLFYESHQVQWALGQRPLASLLAEPQGQYSSAATLAAWGGAGTAEGSAARLALAGRRETVAASPAPISLLQTLFGSETAAASAPVPEQANQTAVAHMIPDDLRPLVQQQLEAAGTQRLAWHGEIWPDQPMDWEIERDGAQGDNAADETAVWHTSLRLTLPHLGNIDARMRLSGQTVQLELRTPSAGSAADLRAAVPALQQAMAAAGLTLPGVQTTHETG
ncbi:MAG: flagellar hook-length control protein FliK [Rhodocyclales bacterium]|nr:flagellar hook-length control protein FliK [Rhodocyclales bacterium]